MDETAATPAAPEGQLVAVPDMAGTAAADAEGRFFGEVYGSLAESGTGLIRYLDLDVHGAGRHVLVPIGHVRIARPGEPSSGVRLRAVTAEEMVAIPSVGQDPDADEEEALLAAFGRFFAGERYYAHPSFDHAGIYRSEQPLVGSGRTESGGELTRFSELDGFELAEGEPDVRGWRVRTRDSIAPGEVTDLVADAAALKVRYAIVRLTDGREVLVPVGYLEVDIGRELLRAPALLADDVRALPALHGSVGRADEDAARAALESRLTGRRRFQRADFVVRP